MMITPQITAFDPDPLGATTDHCAGVVPVWLIRREAGPGRELGCRDTLADMGQTSGGEFWPVTNSPREELLERNEASKEGN